MSRGAAHRSPFVQRRNYITTLNNELRLNDEPIHYCTILIKIEIF
jgi:hypothetical protein